ncbi:MAG: hypothetical protein QXH37_01710 [Candidatus Bathyarchaeia archaeon]
MNSLYQKTFAIILIIIIITTAYFVNAQLTNTATIHNTGQISTTIWAKSGSAEDIQAAVDVVAAAGGGIVYVPRGDFSFNGSRTVYNGYSAGVVVPGGVSVIGAGKDKTNLTCTSETSEVMFYCDGSNNLPIRISGITFKGYGPSGNNDEEHFQEGILMWNGKNYRIDHCRFLDFMGHAILTSCYKHPDPDEYHWNWGLIDHCDIDNPYKERPGTWTWAYGIGVDGGCGSSSPQKEQTWLYNLSDILGRWDIETNPIRCALYDSDGNLLDPYGGKYFRWLVYIEDCTFARCRYAVASNTGGFYVFRHNTVYVSPSYGTFSKAGVDVHEGDTTFVSGRGLEAYNNTIIGCSDSSDQAFKLRAGGGVVFNNAMQDLGIAFWLLKAPWATNERNYVKDLWIWNNTYTNVDTNVSADSFYQEGTHYHFYEKPDYIPFTYPHPLTLSE